MKFNIFDHWLTGTAQGIYWNEMQWTDNKNNPVWVQANQDGSSFTFSIGLVPRPANDANYDPSAEYSYTWLSRP
jgi:hypothetical protein